MAHAVDGTRPTFTESQIEAYFDRLKFPKDQRIYDVNSLSASDALAYLTKLQRYHHVEVPFENLSIHYSQQRGVSTNVDALFKKIVLTPGRGGYCMENNCLFGTLMRCLGYRVYSAGARVCEGSTYSGW
jgi:arylamine N-acetyltransferase